MNDVVSYRVTESRHIPAESGALAAAAVIPVAAGAALLRMLPRRGKRDPAMRLTIAWSGGILAFLAGVRRGLSYRTEGGARQSEILSSLTLFGCAFAALASRSPRASLVSLIAGWAGVGLFDASAARQGEAPPFFARLRPVQVAAPLASFLLILARTGGKEAR